MWGEVDTRRTYGARAEESSALNLQPHANKENSAIVVCESSCTVPFVNMLRFSTCVYWAVCVVDRSSGRMSIVAEFLLYIHAISGDSITTPLPLDSLLISFSASFVA